MSAVTAKQILDTLDKYYGERFNIVREVSMIDPIESRLELAYWYKKYPQHFLSKLLNRGIDPDDLPIIPEGYKRSVTPTIRRIDAIMAGSMDKEGRYPITAVEVKISRSDFKRDTEVKRRAWKSVSSRFIYLVPENLITVEEVPEGCGLWYWVESPYGGDGYIKVAKRAKINKTPENFDEYFTSYMIGRVARAENQLRKLKL